MSELKDETKPTVLYEAPHRLLKTLMELLDAVGGDRRISICRELTKKYETVLQLCLTDAVSFYKSNIPRGEFVLVLDGRSREEMSAESREQWQQISLEQHMEIYNNQGLSKKDAIKMIAKDRGVSKRDIYKEFI